MSQYKYRPERGPRRAWCDKCRLFSGRARKGLLPQCVVCDEELNTDLVPVEEDWKNVR